MSYYNELPDSHKRLIPDFMQNMSKIMECFETNANVIELFAKYKDGSAIFSKDEQDYETNNGLRHSNDMDKVESTLKQFVREWSSEGALERQLCFLPVIDKILNLWYQY